MLVLVTLNDTVMGSEGSPRTGAEQWPLICGRTKCNSAQKGLGMATWEGATPASISLSLWRTLWGAHPLSSASPRAGGVARRIRPYVKHGHLM